MSYQQLDNGCNGLDTNTAPGKSRFMLTVTRELSSNFIQRNVSTEARAILSLMASGFQGLTRYIVH
jgi:hypothetical protein